MRILVHDFAGHPFQIQLSRVLAARGHTVLHVYCASLTTTPRGALDPQPGDPPTLAVEGVALPEPLEKYRFVKRWRQENDYGRRISAVASSFEPEVVLSGNTPLDAQRRLLARCRRDGVRFVFWLQDLIGVASARLLRGRMAGAGTVVGTYYAALERRLLCQSDAVVAITEDFRPILRDYGLRDAAIRVIENWAPLDEVPVRPKTNAWAEAHGLAGKTVLLYSGTLGMKHNPGLLLGLAQRFRSDPAVRIAVVSQGLGADWLAGQKTAEGLENLVLLPFQPFADLPDVLGSADVLLAVLEPEAGVFSVPSKVLSYLCAARPVVLAVPPENLAARLVERAAAGLAVPPTDASAFVKATERLLYDAELRARMGRNARRYAEQAFDIERIADQFEQVLRP